MWTLATSFLADLEDRKIRATGWANQTNVQPVGMMLLGLALLLVLALPRRYALTPFMLLACTAARQRVVIATLDFDFIRLAIVVGWIRVLMRMEVTAFRWKPIDTLFLGWCMTTAIAYTALHKTTGAATLQSGQLVTIAGGYFLFRVLVQNWDDVLSFVRFSAIIAIPVALLIMVEKTTARNLFSVLGGVPPLSQIRDGVVRAQGAFAHPILAGVFWATMVPLFAALWWRGGMDRMLGLAAIGCSVLIVLACASSTPIVALMAAAFAAGMFLYRTKMRQARWALLFMLIFLHMVKTKPVWHMFVYADIIGGSTGWHRYHLIDECIRRVAEWGAIGTQATNHWGPGLRDVTNQFVLVGVRGGLVALAFFIGAISLAFGSVGRLWRVQLGRPAETAMAWALGVTLFTHITSFFAVSYFGQIVTLFTIHMAIIASLSPTKPQFRTFSQQVAARRRAAMLAARERARERAENSGRGEGAIA